MGGYALWQITENLDASVRGGPVFYNFESRTAGEPDQELNSYYMGLNLNHQLTLRITHRLDVRRSVRLGQNQGSDYIEECFAGYGATWSATDRLGLGLALAFTHGTQPVGGLTSGLEEDYDQFSVSSSLNYRFARNLSGVLSYSFYLRESNEDNRNYSQNRVTLGLSHQF